MIDKLIELIEKHRDKWQKKWSKSTQLRDSNSEHYDQFLHGESVGATRAYNNVLQWMKGPSIMSREKDFALTWDDMVAIDSIILDVNNEFAVDHSKEISRQKFYEEVLKRFNEQKKK